MPRSEISGVIISHVWDDDSRTEFRIVKRKYDDSGIAVTLQDSTDDMVTLRPESWPDIRDQIQKMMDEANE